LTTATSRTPAKPGTRWSRQGPVFAPPFRVRAAFGSAARGAIAPRFTAIGHPDDPLDHHPLDRSTAGLSWRGSRSPAFIGRRRVQVARSLPRAWISPCRTRAELGRAAVITRMNRPAPAGDGSPTNSITRDMRVYRACMGERVMESMVIVVACRLRPEFPAQCGFRVRFLPPLRRKKSALLRKIERL
jgi:hypothetical protein